MSLTLRVASLQVHFAFTGCIELAQKIPFGNPHKFVEFLDLIQRKMRGLNNEALTSTLALICCLAPSPGKYQN